MIICSSLAVLRLDVPVLAVGSYLIIEIFLSDRVRIGSSLPNIVVLWVCSHPVIVVNGLAQLAVHAVSFEVISSRLSCISELSVESNNVRREDWHLNLVGPFQNMDARILIIVALALQCPLKR